MKGQVTLTSYCQTNRAKNKNLQGLFSTNNIRNFDIIKCDAPLILGRLHKKHNLDVKTSSTYCIVRTISVKPIILNKNRWLFKFFDNFLEQ